MEEFKSNGPYVCNHPEWVHTVLNIFQYSFFIFIFILVLYLIYKSQNLVDDTICPENNSNHSLQSIRTNKKIAKRMPNTEITQVTLKCEFCPYEEVQDRYSDTI